MVGQTTAYSGSYSTDGYKVTAAMVWSSSTGPGVTMLTSETITSGTTLLGSGTCVETLQSDGATALAKSTTTEGNYALCHFMYWTALTSGDPNLYQATTGTYDWGSSIYMNETQWGTNGGAVKGNGMRGQNSGGTLISATTQGHSLSPTKSSTDKTLKAATYSFEWYQPIWANTYAASALRRYNGGGTEAEKVKAYCVSKRTLAETTAAAHISAGFVAITTVVSLTGASAIASGAIALGVASLAL